MVVRDGQLGRSEPPMQGGCHSCLRTSQCGHKGVSDLRVPSRRILLTAVIGVFYFPGGVGFLKIFLAKKE